MRTLTNIEQSRISGGVYDGNENLEKSRFYLYDIGGALIGGIAGYSVATQVGWSILGQGASILGGCAFGTIFGQVLNRVVSNATKNIND